MTKAIEQIRLELGCREINWVGSNMTEILYDGQNEEHRAMNMLIMLQKAFTSEVVQFIGSYR